MDELLNKEVLDRLSSLLCNVGHHGVIVGDEGQPFEIGEQEIMEAQELFLIVSSAAKEAE